MDNNFSNLINDFNDKYVIVEKDEIFVGPFVSEMSAMLFSSRLSIGNLLNLWMLLTNSIVDSAFEFVNYFRLADEKDDSIIETHISNLEALVDSAQNIKQLITQKQSMSYTDSVVFKNGIFYIRIAQNVASKNTSKTN